MKLKKINQTIKEYYSTKFKDHGPSSKGVDWSSEESQINRFIQLSRIIDRKENFNLLDYGCGFGSFYTFLKNNYSHFSYSGFDLVHEMIEYAKNNLNKENQCHFEARENIKQEYDYIISSGIFNVKFDHKHKDWYEHIINTLESFNLFSLEGFAFNCLSLYSDPEKMREDLFYADPLKLFDYCKKRFSKNVALLHDYNLFEFTILVRKYG